MMAAPQRNRLYATAFVVVSVAILSLSACGAEAATPTQPMPRNTQASKAQIIGIGDVDPDEPVC